MQTPALFTPAVGSFQTDRHSSRPLSLAWLALLVFTLMWDFTGLDMVVMKAIGTPQGFPLKDQWLLSAVLHDELRLVAQALFLVMVGWAVWPVKTRGLPRRERLLLVGLVLLSLLTVNLVKINSRTSCPWDLQVFGGSARYVSHWLFAVGDGGLAAVSPVATPPVPWPSLPCACPGCMRPPACSAQQPRAGTGYRSSWSSA